MAYPDTLARPNDSTPVFLSKMASVLSAANGNIFVPKLGDSEQVLLFKIASILNVQYSYGATISPTHSEYELLFLIANIHHAQYVGLNSGPYSIDTKNSLWFKIVYIMNGMAPGECQPMYMDSDNTLQIKALKLFSGLCGGGGN